MDFNKEEGKTVFESGFQFKFFVWNTEARCSMASADSLTS